MEVERVINGGATELWGYDWDLSVAPPLKTNRRFLATEQPVIGAITNYSTREAICWSYGRTLGNIAVFDESVIGDFPAGSGNNALLACQIVDAGLWQNGQQRWWCRTHQQHWGKKADVAVAERDGIARCAMYTQPMSYVVDPAQIRLDDHAEIGIWCSLPAAMTSTGSSPSRHPRVHVHLRNEPNGEKVLDRDFDALTLLYNPQNHLFADRRIDRVHVTPPAAREFVLALEQNTAIGCVSCAHCGYPHLDLGEFARTPHRKHLCGNCGRDHTWTSAPMTSTPLKLIHDQYCAAWTYVDVEREINIDHYPGAAFALWASTPAIVWTANRPQERGIHVHLSMDGERIIDDTYGVVIYKGRSLIREELFDLMLQNTLD